MNVRLPEEKERESFIEQIITPPFGTPRERHSCWPRPKHNPFKKRLKNTHKAHLKVSEIQVREIINRRACRFDRCYNITDTMASQKSAINNHLAWDGNPCRIKARLFVSQIINKKKNGDNPPFVVKLHLDISRQLLETSCQLRAYILSYYIGTFVGAMISFILLIEDGKMYEDSITKFVLILLISQCWLYKNMFLLLILSLECEQFYSDMAEIFKNGFLVLQEKMLFVADALDDADFVVFIHNHDNVLRTIMLAVRIRGEMQGKITLACASSCRTAHTTFEIDKVLFRTINAFSRNLCIFEFVLQVVTIKEQNNGKMRNIRILILLNKYVGHWIKEIGLMSNDREDDEVYCKKKFATYQNILEAFNVYKVLYEVLVLFRTINAFSRNLCIFEFVLQVVTIKEQNNGKVPLASLIMGYMSLVAIIKDLVQVCFYCLYCEKFYIALENAEEACLRRMKNVNYTKGQEKLCIDVIRENRKFCKLTACGLFHVDAKLPLSFLEYFTSYAIKTTIEYLKIIAKADIEKSKLITLMRSMNTSIFLLKRTERLTAANAIKMEKIKRNQKSKQDYRSELLLQNYIDRDVQSIMPFYNIFCGFCITIFDVNMVSAIMLIKLLKDKLVLWNIQIKNVQSMDESEKKNNCKKVFQSYNDILECYDIYRICFQQQHPELILLMYRNFLTYFIWLIKKSTFGFLLSLEFENFYEAINDIRETCRLMVISNCSDIHAMTPALIKKIMEIPYETFTSRNVIK
ncbi:hypothetical protein HW555_012974 [Spodoptera exigua]|uniref:Uncharacterized protein n=1 Tax=Spodoptera exigua TaxID=7107 RepID=A0A835G5K6_SPOEX|nr:hypothetical protein HW555_012974 [Spodoptera exigua]